MPKADEPSRRTPTVKSTRFLFFALMLGVRTAALDYTRSGVGGRRRRKPGIRIFGLRFPLSVLSVVPEE
jgi:hypothetical protein